MQTPLNVVVCHTPNNLQRELFRWKAGEMSPPYFTHYSASTREKTVLVVESNPRIGELLAYVFKFSTYTCSIVEAEQIASLTWIEDSVSLLPAGIVLDVDIPALGREPLDVLHTFCERWHRASLSMPPLILLTTQAVISDELRHCEDVDTVILKPFKPGVLLDTVKTAIERKSKTANHFARPSS